MKLLKNKDFTKLLINIICVCIIILFFAFSSLLKIIFNKYIIIVGCCIVFILILIEILLKKQEQYFKVFVTINEYVQVILVAVVLVQVVFTFIMFPATVFQNSMYPTLLPEDQLIIKCTKNLKNNDIIVFKYDNKIQPDNIGVSNDELLVKRVIAIPGQTFYYENSKLYIDNVEVVDNYVVSQMNGLSLEDICIINNMEEQCLQEDGSYILPKGWYVVFGDNRQYASNNIPVSIDSRSFGLIHESQIYGKAIFKVESIFNWKKLN